MGDAIIIAFAVFYIEVALREGNILHFWRAYLSSPDIPSGLSKPLGLCKYCMSFWASLAMHLLLAPDWTCPVLALGSAGIASALFMGEEIFFDVTEEG